MVEAVHEVNRPGVSARPNHGEDDSLARVRQLRRPLIAAVSHDEHSRCLSMTDARLHGVPNIDETRERHTAGLAGDLEQSARLAVFNEYRTLLLSMAYRMLGSVADAEDIVQDTFVRWQATSAVDIRSPRAFLVTIVSRLCINHLQSARVRREKYVGAWLPEPVFTGGPVAPFERSPADESLSLAFLLVLERLSPVERAVFLLREVFDYEYGEIARMIGHKDAACRQILRRAKQHIARARPRFRTSPQHREDLLRRFQAATSHGDMDALITLLCDDVVLYADGGGKTTAVPLPIRGAAKVARFILRAPTRLLPSELVKRVHNVNGQPAIVSYVGGRPHSVFSLEIVDGRIREIFIVSNPDKLSGLPPLSACAD